MANDPNHAAAQIGLVGAADFTAAIGTPFAIRLVAGPGANPGSDLGADGSEIGTLEAATLHSVVELPKSAVPGSARTPFLLHIEVPNPGKVVVGYGMIDVPGKGPLGPVYFERKLPPPGNTGTGGYYEIQFG